MASQILRRIVASAGLDEVIRRVNAVIDALNGNRPGRVNLDGDDGAELNPIGGASISTGNHALRVRAASGEHVLVRNAANSADLLEVDDTSGVTTGALSVGGNLTIVGTVRRLRADLSNATISNRLLVQSSTTNGESRLGIIPNGTATKAGWAAYSSATPDNSHYVELLANATDNTIDLITSKAGTGTTRDVRLVVDSTVVAKLVAATLALRLENTRWLAGYSTGAAEVPLIRLNGSDIIETGQTGTRHNLLGTVVGPSIDPPTVNGQVTAYSQCKAYAHVELFGGAAVMGDNYNVSSVTKNGTGDYSIAWDRDFSTGTYPCVVTVEHSSMLIWRLNSTKAASGTDVIFETLAGVRTDPNAWHIVAFGTLS